MANTISGTTVSVRVINSLSIPVVGVPVMLLNPVTDANPFGLTTRTVVATVAYSGTSDGNGYARFTGVAAAAYDIEVINPSGNAIYSRGYIVNNSYVVSDPVNQFGSAESRFAVRSGEHIQGVGNGILARSASNPQGTMYSQPYTWSRDSIQPGGVLSGTQMLPNVLNGTGTLAYQDPMAGTIFTVANDNESKIAGLSYYHDNQYVVLFQKMDIMIR